MEYLQSVLDQVRNPMIIALILGIMTAISPCPLATNITAIGFISKEINNRRQVFFNGILYTVGRAIGYFVIALILYFGASTFHVARFVQTYGERILGPFLIIAGLFMLEIIHIRLPGSNNLFNRMAEKRYTNRGISSLLLGIIFALAFCPYGAMLFFGVLIPLTIASPQGLILPLIYAVATGIPVIIFAYIIAYSFSEVSHFYNKIAIVQRWFNRIIAVLFILTGIYFIYLLYISHL